MRGARAARGTDRGFVLVGVVMMVLALTIIGLSLYGLSGYESQFFGRTLNERVALYRGASGIERAKKLLITPLGSPPAQRLSNVQFAVGQDNVVSALAWYDSPPDSSGPVRWNAPVNLRVRVNVNGVVRTIEGIYQLSQPNSPYWRLFTAPSIDYAGGSDRTLVCTGGAWQTVQAARDSAWIRDLDRASRVALLPTAAPANDAASFIAANATTNPADSGAVTRDWDYGETPPTYGTATVTLNAGNGAGDSKVFWAVSDTLTVGYAGLKDDWDWGSNANVHVDVAGTAVWVVPRGAIFNGEFWVRRLPGAAVANLVLVVGPKKGSSGDPTLAVFFNKGIWTPNDDANVFIVSSGRVQIEDHRRSEDDVVTRNLCVFAPAIRLRGPDRDDESHRMRLAYQPGLRVVADDLWGRGLLPGFTGAQPSSFTLVGGSWRSTP